MSGLVDDIRGAISPDTINALASRFGESPENTGNAMNAAVPTVLAALAGRVQGNDAGGIANLIQSALSRGNPFDRQAELANPPAAGVEPHDGGLASGVLGGSFGTIATNLADKFGLKADSLRTLLGVAGLFGAGGIGRALGGNVTPQGLTDLMNRERPSIMSALPAGVGGMLGSLGGAASGAAGRVGGMASDAAGRVGGAASDTAAAVGGGIGRWIPWLLLIAAIIAAFLLFRGCSTQPETPTPAPVTVPADEVAPITTETPVAAPTGSGVRSETRNGKPALIVYFDVGKSAVSIEMATAATGVKDYIAKNPNATLAVSGFNDPTGNAAANERLSRSRAEEVSKALAANGIPAGSIKMVKPAEASGTGSSNAESRRVEVTVAD